MNNNNNENGNSEIPVVEDLVIEEGDTKDVIDQKIATHKEQLTARDEWYEDSNKQLFARTKKAEGFEFKDGKWVKAQAPANDKPEDKKPEDKPTIEDKSATEGLSSSDVIAVINAKIPQEDIPDVAEYAKFKKISVAEALNDNVVKLMLADKAEQRKIAEGTATGDGKKRGSSKLSDEALLANASKGILPESDEDMSRLSRLQLNRNRQ